MDQDKWEYILGELVQLKADLAELQKQFDELKEQPAEILQAIEDIWRGDPEVRADVQP